MQTTRANFKYALRWCKNNERTAKADALASDLINKNDIQFWKHVDQQASSRVPLANTVGGATGHKNIAYMWHDHFKDLFSSVRTESHKAFVEDTLLNVNPLNCMFTVMDIKYAIEKLDNGKACGLDGISSEHVAYAGDRLAVLLMIIFNACMTHGYLPPNMISTVLVPIIKDKSGDVGDRSNYRPIAISSVFSKILEHVLLKHIESYLYTSDNQFGFKAKHSTDQCIYLLKEVIQYYKSHKSPMFLCFMDASKAFDRVNHWTLFKKLI